MPLRTAAIALATVVLAALLYGAYWWLAAVSMRQGFDSWAAERRADGWTVSFGAVSLGGFPSRLALRIEAPSIGAPPAAGGWQWHGPLVVVAGSPWSSRRAAWTAPGLHRLVTASGTPIEVLAGSAEGAIERSPDRGPVTVTIEIGAATVLPLAGQPRRTIQRIEASVVLPDRAGPAIDLRVAGIDLGETPFIGLGAGIEEVGLAAELRGRLVPGARVRALEIWRDGGGTLEITRLRLRWQRIEVDARGTVALDRALQPIAALSADIAGYGLLIDTLAARGAIGQGSARTVKFALDVVALAGGNAGRRITVPVTVQDGRLSLGPVPVLRLPRIAWR